MKKQCGVIPYVGQKTTTIRILGFVFALVVVFPGISRADVDILNIKVTITPTPKGDVYTAQGTAFYDQPVSVIESLLADMRNYHNWAPTIAKSEIREEVTTPTGRQFLFVAAHEGVPLIGDFPCELTYQEFRKAGSYQLEWKQRRCWFDWQHGLYKVEPTEQGEAMLTYRFSARKDAWWLPDIAMRMLLEKSAKDTFEAVDKRACELHPTPRCTAQ